MSETDEQPEGNGEMQEALARAIPVAGVQMKEGITYMMVPAPLMIELVKILSKMPFEDVEGVIVGLRKCPPVRSNRPEAPAE